MHFALYTQRRSGKEVFVGPTLLPSGLQADTTPLEVLKSLRAATDAADSGEAPDAIAFRVAHDIANDCGYELKVRSMRYFLNPY